MARHLTSLGISLVACAALSGCATASGAAPLAGAPPRGAAPPAAIAQAQDAAAPPDAPSAPWAVVFERACQGSITTPVVARDGAAFAFCSGLFDLPRGQFRTALPIGVVALLPDEKLLAASYTDEGLLLASLPKAPGARGGAAEEQAGGESADDSRTSGGGFVEQALVAPDGTRAVAALRSRDASGDEHAFVALVALPELAIRMRAALDSKARDAELGMLADGTPIVLADHGCVTLPEPCGEDASGGECARTTCKGRRVARVADGKLEPLGTAFEDVAHMAVAANGSRALLVRRDRSRALVALPGGELVAALAPLGADDDPRDAQALGIDAAGRRIAYLEGDAVVVADAGAAGLRALGRVPGVAAESLTFAPDAHALFAATSERVAVLREGAAPALAPLVAYRPELPAGFVESYNRAAPPPPEPEDPKGAVIVRERVAGEVVSERLMPSTTVAVYRHESVLVSVQALDPGEFPPADAPLAAWQAALVARDFGDVNERPASLRGWQRGSERTLEYSTFPREGCDPMDEYVRYSERAGVLYAIRVEVPPGMDPREVAPLLAAFFDAPLGPGAEPRTFAATRRLLPGPC